MAIAALPFTPTLILDSNAGDAARNFPITLQTFGPGADKSEIYRLRYRSFRHAGWIGPRTIEEFTDTYDELASSLTIAAYRGQACVGTMRLTFGGESFEGSTMPCEASFPLELDRLKAAGHRRIVEFTRLAVEPELSNTSFRATLYGTLLRAGTILALAGGVDYAVIAVHEKLARVYRFLCGFEELARASTYGDIGEPTHLLGREFDALNSRCSARNAFFRISAEDIDRARLALAKVAPAIAVSHYPSPTRS